VKPTNKTLKIIAIVFSLIVIGLGTTVLVKKWHQDQMSNCRQQSEADCLELIREMESELNEVKAQLEKAREALPGNEEITAVFGEPSTESEAVDCETIEAQMTSFYQHLDDQPYLVSRGLPGGSAAFFQECAVLLTADPPANIAEMKDLLRLVKNVTHLYRVLGKKRLVLAQEIMENESEIVEPSMALLYARSVECNQPLGSAGKPLNLERLYDYAGYFLNTLGGRSYLLRRDSKMRMLMTYYSILIVDKANDEKFNQYGIDIRPHIDFLFYDVTHQRGLVYKDRYLSRLTALRNKYP
jgi:hypothetical protein